MTNTVSKREICFIKAVLFLCEHGHFLLNFASLGVNAPPPHYYSITIRVNVKTTVMFFKTNILYLIKMSVNVKTVTPNKQTNKKSMSD